MKKIFRNAVMALGLGATALAVSAPAEARGVVHYRGHGNGGAVLAAGVAGLAIGAALAGDRGYPAYGYYYDDYPVYEGPAYYGYYSYPYPYGYAYAYPRGGYRYYGRGYYGGGYYHGHGGYVGHGGYGGHGGGHHR